MELLLQGIDILLHLDKYLDLMIQTMGVWSYVIIFLIIFCETGLVVSLTLAGYFFGNIPIVRNNFSLVIVAIVVISVLPGVIEYLRQRRKAA
jgi:membrane protein DedA with SNARE-associated domain